MISYFIADGKKQKFRYLRDQLQFATLFFSEQFPVWVACYIKYISIVNRNHSHPMWEFKIKNVSEV